MTQQERIRAAIAAYDVAITALMDAPQFGYVQADIIELQGSRDLIEAMLEADPADLPDEAYDADGRRDQGMVS